MTVKKRLQNKATLEITSLYPLFITELEKVETSSAEIERLRGKIRQIETKRLCDHLQESLLKPFDQHRRRYLDNLSSGNLKNQTEVKKAFIAYLKQAQKLAE